LIAKALDVKEPRMAQADAIKAALGVAPPDGVFFQPLMASFV
jgi:hypothetical protein